MAEETANETATESEVTTPVSDDAPAPAAKQRKAKAKTATKKVANKKEKKVVKKTATKTAAVKKNATESTQREPIDMAKARKNDYSIDTNGRVRVKCENPKCKGGEKASAYTGARGTNLDAPCPRCGKDSIKPVINSEKKTPGRTAGDSKKTVKKTAAKKGAKRAKRAQKEAA